MRIILPVLSEIQNKKKRLASKRYSEEFQVGSIESCRHLKVLIFYKRETPIGMYSFDTFASTKCLFPRNRLFVVPS